MRKKMILIVFLHLTFFGYSQTNPFQQRFPLIDRYIDSLMKTWNIPGLALGIVYGDQLIYGKGYGYRDLENKLPVQTATIFPIASNTKLFTATTACMLAMEGKLSLDKPAKTYMPSLNFFNDELNAKVTLRDMLSHRTGLPTYNGIWVASPYSRKETVEKVIYMKPQLGFREGYIYNNMMFAASGAVMENITGDSWEVITRKRIFQPLEMNSSFFTNEEMQKTGNFAHAYFEPDSTRNLKRVTYIAQSEALGPAGTIKSNIEDMSHWMIMQLNKGKYKGRQVVPDSVINETLIPNNIADREGRWNEVSNSLYGLGRIVQTYKGYKITMHTGSIDGYYSNLTFIPSEKLAVFVVHNSQPAGILRSVLAFLIIDRLLNISRTNWSERYMSIYLKDKADDIKNKDSIRATAVKNTVPSHSLKDFAGTYYNPIYGDMNIELDDNYLFLVFRKQRSPLLHFHFDQFITDEHLNGRSDFRLHFLTNSRGEIERISFRPFGDPVAEFVKINK
ncbi:MAG: serine hydrolase [Chitinophagaceae bacterium]|nr:serine hydrolase [Chitinophagaceae bacterium]